MSLEDALRNPAARFETPAEVVRHSAFSAKDKIRILRRWEYDLRELLVAEEENMTGGSSSELLREVHAALRSLGDDAGEGGPSPTKQGGA